MEITILALTGHPLHHEYEVISNFLRRGAAWIKIEENAASAILHELDSPSEEYIEHIFCGANGPVELERIICRSTINELNALIEVTLQEALQNTTSAFLFRSNEFIIGAKFTDLIKELANHGIELEKIPQYNRILEIKELSEGFKHRQGLGRLPKFKNKTWTASNGVLPSAEEAEFRKTELGIVETTVYLEDVRQFLIHCQSLSLI